MPNSEALKVVLVSNSGYDSSHDDILKKLVNRKIELFCAVGKDCQKWEDFMDELCVGDGSDVQYITTTSHPDEPVNEVIEFARLWSGASGLDDNVEVIEV
ncbi:MAG: hypothetical protein AB7L92_03855 [Alphaproteobacteria bacterium]